MVCLSAALGLMENGQDIDVSDRTTQFMFILPLSLFGLKYD